MLTRFVALLATARTALLTLVTLLLLPRATPPPPRARGRHETRSDRGDVPGWVLITVMTAALVVALWALAGEAFTSLFTDSINRVRQAG